MKNIKVVLTVSLCLFASLAFCQSDKVATIVKGINVYFPNSEVQGNKLNLNVQGRIVAIPLCKTDIAKVDDHNFSFTCTDKTDKLMRGDEPTTSVKLLLVHSTNDKLVALLNDLKATVCK